MQHVITKIIYQYIEGEKGGLKVCIGLDANGNNVWLDMLNTHLLIGGMARKGKSSLIRSILVGLMLTYTPNEVKFVLCDFKNSDVKLLRFCCWRGLRSPRPADFCGASTSSRKSEHFLTEQELL